VSQRGKLDIDLIIFFKYLKGLKEEKSVKSLGFKMDKHPSTIRRMIGKVEEYLEQDILIYENYEVKPTVLGELLLEQYDLLGDNINLEHLVNIEKKSKKGIKNIKNIVITSDILLPYVHGYIRREKLSYKSIYTGKKNQSYHEDDIIFHHFPFSFLPQDKVCTSNVLPLYLMRNSQYPQDNSLIIHWEIKRLIDKLIDLSVFNNIIVVDNIFSLIQGLNESGAYCIFYEDILANNQKSLFIKKPLLLYLTVYCTVE
jgi:hypothetical protein